MATGQRAKAESQTLSRLDREAAKRQHEQLDALVSALVQLAEGAVLAVADEAHHPILAFNEKLIQLFQLEAYRDRLSRHEVNADELLGPWACVLGPRRVALPEPDDSQSTGDADWSRLRVDGIEVSHQVDVLSDSSGRVCAHMHVFRPQGELDAADRNRSMVDRSHEAPPDDDADTHAALDIHVADDHSMRQRLARSLELETTLRVLGEILDGHLGSTLRTLTELGARALHADRLGYWQLATSGEAFEPGVIYDAGLDTWLTPSPPEVGDEASDDEPDDDPRQAERGDKPSWKRTTSVRARHDAAASPTVPSMTRRDLGDCWDHLQHRRRVVMTDTSGRPIAEADWARAEVMVPIVVEGTLHGVLRCQQCRSPRAWTEEEQRFVAALAEIAVRALTRNTQRHAETALIQMQRQVLLSDRLASVGTLAAGVAHEINNPLAFVIANVGYVSEAIQAAAPAMRKAWGEKPPLDIDELMQALGEALEGSDRVRLIVQSLRSFSQSETWERHNIDVRSMLGLSIRMVGSSASLPIAFDQEIDSAVVVVANEAELGQIFVNVLQNAVQATIDATSDAPTIKVRAHMKRCARHEERIHSSEEEAGAPSVESDGACGCRAIVEVIDNGSGMTEEQRRRAFDPFYTTRPVGAGTGLGLFVARNLAHNLGGDIDVSSSIGNGTAVRISLPGHIDGPSVKKASRRDREGRTRVLVIDDEPTIGRVVERMLRKQHDVVAVFAAKDGLDKLLNGEHFDAILCDLLMPEMTGMELYEEVLQKRPEMARRMVFFTGGAFTPRAESFIKTVPNPCIEKPFDASTLRNLLADVTEQEEEAATGGSDGETAE